MFTRILSSTLAAAALVTAAPALATDGATSPPKHDCTCCSDPSAMHRHHEAARAAERMQANQAGAKAQQRPANDDPFARNESFGG